MLRDGHSDRACQFGNPGQRPQSHEVLSWNKKTVSRGRKAFYGKKNHYDFLWFGDQKRRWRILEIRHFLDRNQSQGLLTKTLCKLCTTPHLFVLLFSASWSGGRKHLKPEQACVLVIRSSSQTGSLGNWMLLLSPRVGGRWGGGGWWGGDGWWGGREADRRPGSAAKEDRELWWGTRWEGAVGLEKGLAVQQQFRVWTRLLRAARSVTERW